MEIQQDFQASKRKKRSKKCAESVPGAIIKPFLSTSDTYPARISDAIRLDFSFFNQPCITLAKKLLGKVLVRKLATGELLKGRIVETESYVGVMDKASHSYNGKITERNKAMYMKPGTAYVYSIYGMYFCFNISSLEEGSAVLLRALEPLDGCDIMRNCRKKRKNGELKIKDLCNGPSKLCQSFCINKTLNKVDLETSESLWLEDGVDIDDSNVVKCKRIGIDSYGDEWSNKPLRFYVRNSLFVSRRNKPAELIVNS